MMKFPNRSFRKYTYPKNHSIRLSSLNPLLSSQEYILYEYREEYNPYYNENPMQSIK